MNNNEEITKINAAEKFDQILDASIKFRNYGWSKGKEVSMRWIVDNIVGNKILDVGGTSRLIKYLSAKGVMASIFDKFPCNDLKENEFDEMYVGEFSKIVDVIGDKKFDTITCRHSLEHSLNPMFVLWQLNQILIDAGRLIIILPPHLKNWIWFYTHFNCLPEENWEMLFYRAGFNITSKTYGYWDDMQQNPVYREIRYILQSETKELRL